MKKIRLVTITIALLLTNMAFANESKDDKVLAQIVKDFEIAIIERDKAKFLSLFVDGTVSWIGVFATKDYDEAKSRADAAIANGETVRMPMKSFQSDPEKFMDSISKSGKVPRETFENVKIHQDGEIATIYFDYAFYYGDIKQNWGKESWHLVNTEQGWKINSVIFSMTTD